ncbi:MAG: OmpH family outer membrane protein [Bacteroidales bacterium]|nr:OmpH family outer membrane protein [Bacteroidales bacterium]
MKRTVLLLSGLLFTFSLTIAQKYAFVDTDYILDNIPGYKAAQEQLDKLSEGWQQEIEAQYAEIEQLYNDYQAERVLLSEEMRRKREDEIIDKEKDVKEIQTSYFGQEGQLFQKRQELIQPIQDEVYNAIRDMATEEGYAVIFDTAGGPVMVYFNPRYDLSDEVLQKLGYKN